VGAHATAGIGRPDRWTIETAEPVWAPAPGQAAVIYDGTRVVAGGRIVPVGRD
jgi:tRNA U34 2-thiouridine synthase MnmA/TrmU